MMVSGVFLLLGGLILVVLIIGVIVGIALLMSRQGDD